MDLIGMAIDGAYILLAICAIWIATFIFIRYFGRFMKEADKRSKAFDIDERTFKSLDQILDTIAIVMAIALSLSVMGISGVLYATLTAFGVIGIIIGLAVKDLTSNVFAGIMMLFNPSFLCGDYIEIDRYAGTVEKISLRMTEIRRSDGVILSIPNTMFVTKPIINYSMTKKRRVEIKVGIANESDIEEALMILKTAAEEHAKTLQSESVDVVMTDVKDYAVDLTLRFWVPPLHLRSSTSEVLKKITTLFKKHKIELAVPLRRYV